MADPKITLHWDDNNADETGHSIYITSEPWERNAPKTKIKDVPADATSADLTLAEITIEPGFLQVAAVRGADTKMSREYAMVIKTPVITNPVFIGAYENLGQIPNGVPHPTITKGVPASYPKVGEQLDLTQGYTVTPDGVLLQFYGGKVRTFNPATGAQTVVSITGDISQIGSSICMADDGNAYLMGRNSGNVTLFRYKMDEEPPEAVYSWPFGSGAGADINPSNIKQGADGRLYMFGGYQGFTSANTMVVNSIKIDGTEPRTDVMTIPAGWNTGMERVVCTAQGEIVVWQPDSSSILSYDPLKSGGPGVDVYSGHVNLTNGTGDNPSSRRAIIPADSWGVFIAGKGEKICKFQFEDNAQVFFSLPLDFVTDAVVREMYNSVMGWIFVSNTSGACFVAKDDGSEAGTTYTPADMGMENTFDGHTFVRIGKTVYMMAADSDTFRVCPFTIGSPWQSTGPFDAASIINTNARGQNS